MSNCCPCNRDPLMGRGLFKENKREGEKKKKRNFPGMNKQKILSENLTQKQLKMYLGWVTGP